MEPWVMDDGHLSSTHLAGGDPVPAPPTSQRRSRRWGWALFIVGVAVMMNIPQVVRPDLGSVGSLQVGDCLQLVAEAEQVGSTDEWGAATHHLVDCRGDIDKMVVTAMSSSVDQCPADALSYVVRAFGRTGAVACLVPVLSLASCYAHDPVTGYRHVGCSDEAARVRVDEITPGTSAEVCQHTDIAVVLPEEITAQAMVQCLVAP